MPRARDNLRKPCWCSAKRRTRPRPSGSCPPRLTTGSAPLFPGNAATGHGILATHRRQELLASYQELAEKFPQGLAEVKPLVEELSGEVNAAFAEAGG